MRLLHLAIFFYVVSWASSADKLWLADCEIQCMRSSDRYRDLKKRFPKHEDLEKQMIKQCEKADNKRKNRRIPVCDTAVALILNNWKAKKQLKDGEYVLQAKDMDFDVLYRYCKYGCKKHAPKK